MMAGLKAVKVEKGFGFALGTVASGGISGGIASVIGGGTFGAGFRNGAISAGLNHLAHENGWYGNGGNKSKKEDKIDLLDTENLVTNFIKALQNAAAFEVNESNYPDSYTFNELFDIDNLSYESMTRRKSC